MAPPLSEGARGRWRLPSYARVRRHRAALVVAAGCMATLVAHAMSYYPFFSDDSFISLRYARRLLNGQGLTWDDHERVEGYTNLLWTLSCSVLGLVQRDLVTCARLLGVSSACAAQLAIIYTYRPHHWRSLAPALAGGGVIAASGGVAVWAIGGLEQPLLAACVAWGLALLFSSDTTHRASAAPSYSPRLVLASLSLGLACLTRADALLLVVGILAGHAAGHGFSRTALRRVATAALVPMAFVIVQLLARRAYYGEWVPNSAFAKVAFTQHRLEEGLAYVKGAVAPLEPLLVPLPFAVLLALFDRVRRARLCALLAATAAWLGYVAVIGGDIFPARRHLVVLVVLLAFVAAEVLAALTALRRPRYAVAHAAAVALVLAFATTQSHDAENTRAMLERWEWDARPVGTMLKHGFAVEQPLVAVDAAGALPYFSELPSIDMLGINDHYLAHHPPPGFGEGYLGHELGDGKYVLSRKPDLIVFFVPTGDDHAAFRSGREVEADPSFASLYQLVTFQTAAPERLNARLWVRKEDGRIGIARGAGVVRVPAHLLANDAAPAQWNEGGFTAIVSPDAPGKLAVFLEVGPWHMTLADASSTITVALSCAVTEDTGRNEFAFEVSDQRVRCDFELRPRDALLARVGALTLQRAPSR